jgi:hypothetical protein
VLDELDGVVCDPVFPLACELLLLVLEELELELGAEAS